MPANESTVNQGANGQYKTTVPKGLAEAFDLDGQKLEWKVDSGTTLSVSIIKNE